MTSCFTSDEGTSKGHFLPHLHTGEGFSHRRRPMLCIDAPEIPRFYFRSMWPFQAGVINGETTFYSDCKSGNKSAVLISLCSISLIPQHGTSLTFTKTSQCCICIFFQQLSVNCKQVYFVVQNVFTSLKFEIFHIMQGQNWHGERLTNSVTHKSTQK